MMPVRALVCFVALVGLALPSSGREVVVARVEGIVGPALARFMIQSIDRAERQDAECIVFELDTPGGLDDSMRQIVKRIMASKVPVVVYVAPSGSRAASAGVFIAMAAHVAAMAPGTAIGAAHPVSLGGGMEDTNMAAKVTNDAAAYIRSIAEKRGRNGAWVETAVRESVSLTETEALDKKVIDLVAPTRDALLNRIDGRTVALDGATRKLDTKNAPVVGMTMSWRDRFLAILGNPNVAYVLFLMGLLGIYFELATPGAILPGVVGAISLILAFFAFQTLPVNYAAVMLIVLAVILFIVDIKAATHGVLTVGGLAAMFMGSIMLFNTPEPALRVSYHVAIPAVLVVAAFFIMGAALSLRSMGRKPVTGEAGLVGQEGEARTAVDGANGGQVFLAGTHWNATARSTIPEGARIRVVGIQGMTLTVEEVSRDKQAV